MNLWELGTGWHRDEKTKVALFLVLSENDSSYNFLGNMLYQQLFDELLREADQNYHGRLPIRVECWMDEFANGLRPERFENFNITFSKYRSHALLAINQSVANHVQGRWLEGFHGFMRRVLISRIWPRSFGHSRDYQQDAWKRHNRKDFRKRILRSKWQ